MPDKVAQLVAEILAAAAVLHCPQQKQAAQSHVCLPALAACLCSVVVLHDYEPVSTPVLQACQDRSVTAGICVLYGRKGACTAPKS